MTGLLEQSQACQPLLLRASALGEDEIGGLYLEEDIHDGLRFDLEEIVVRCRSTSPRSPSGKSSKSLRKKVKKSASMKLKRSWLFPAFRLGGSSHNTTSIAKNTTKEDESLKKSIKAISATSLVRRSSSRLNISSDVAFHPSPDNDAASATPILLSVRKRSTSDSGYSGEDSYATSSSHCGEDSPVPPYSANKKRPPPASTVNHGLSFLRLFHKSSATLQLQHPKYELNPDKPYKGTIVTSAAASAKKKESLRKSRKLPLAPMVSSSLSSLNTLSSQVHHQPPLLASSAAAAQHAHSSSNSVISTGDESTTGSGGRGSTSNYDSDAFSRTSSPTEDILHHHPANLSLSASRLALAEPLLAPRLVLAACRGEEWPGLISESEVDGLGCRGRLASNVSRPHLPSVAERARQVHKRQMRARSMSAANRKAAASDVTVSVNANTMLTIGIEGSSPQRPQRLSNLRRSRSGLPVLGTTMLNSAAASNAAASRFSPVKPSRMMTNGGPTRSKISTVYLSEAGSSPASKKVNRSASVVTIMGAQPQPQSRGGRARQKCDCVQVVTVNGQHHCCSGDDLVKSIVDRSTNTTPLVGNHDPTLIQNAAPKNSISEPHSV